MYQVGEVSRGLCVCASGSKVKANTTKDDLVTQRQATAAYVTVLILLTGPLADIQLLSERRSFEIEGSPVVRSDFQPENHKTIKNSAINNLHILTSDITTSFHLNTQDRED